MPTAANVTVKKNDGTTDILYTLQQGASGDNPAQWYGPALGATSATRPELRFTHKRQASQPSKTRVVATFMMPYPVVNTTTGVTSVERRLIHKMESTFDGDIPTTTIDESVSQFVNLLVALKASMKEGVAPT